MNWLFQYNPKRFDLTSKLAEGLASGDWAMNQHRDLVSPGDRVFFWQTGQDAKLIAVGYVVSPVYIRKDEGFGSYCADVVFDSKIIPPITRDEVLNDGVLRGFSPFKGAMGTNFPITDLRVVSELERVVEKRLVPIASSIPSTPNIQTQKSLHDAIKAANADVKNRLREYVSTMDATAFEWLARYLFMKLGYSNVTVTKRSGDGGIDVRATLNAAGVTSIPTSIQVKRQKSVGRPVVQNLRGSIGPHELGIIVTSGAFSQEAVDDAADEKKARITLIDGSRLIEMLTEFQIGVQTESVSIYRLSLDDIADEKLRSVTEETGDGT